jgi:hypothetical protein
MDNHFVKVFGALKPVFAKHEKRLVTKTDSPLEYTLVTRYPSPFPQHKGHPMYFASVRRGKAYVSLHLMPLYMCPELSDTISPALRKRMHGKTCFNFKSEPEPELMTELERLTAAGLRLWGKKTGRELHPY